jgi:predicted nucleic acid-binding protein
MKSNYLLDTYAWVEYVIGSNMGEFVDTMLKTNNIFYTPSIVIAELSDKFNREDKLNEWNTLYKFIKHNSEIVILDEVLANQSGKQKKELREKLADLENQDNKVGLADAIIYQTALNLKGKLITGDSHFENIEGVLYLKNSDSLQKELDLIEKNI